MVCMIGLENRSGLSVEGCQQSALPVIPNLRAGATNICDGEDVERLESLNALDLGSESGDHLRVGKVLLLRDRGHGQVFSDEKLKQLCRLGVQSELSGKSTDLKLSKLGVIAPSALRNIVKQRGEIELPGGTKVGHQLGEFRKLVGVFVHAESTQIANDLKDVLIHRVNMEQIVLHLPDDAPENGKHSTEDAQIVHESQGMNDSLRLLKECEECSLILRLLPKRFVHPNTSIPECASGPCGHFATGGVTSHHEKGSKNGARLTLEQIVGLDVKKATSFTKL
jgi:hypothetical protein